MNKKTCIFYHFLIVQPWLLFRSLNQDMDQPSPASERDPMTHHPIFIYFPCFITVPPMSKSYVGISGHNVLTTGNEIIRKEKSGDAIIIYSTHIINQFCIKTTKSLFFQFFFHVCCSHGLQYFTRPGKVNFSKGAAADQLGL